MTSRQGLARTRRRAPAWRWARHDSILVGRLSAKVGDHLIGRFCGCSPTPSAGRPNRNPGRPQIAADRLPPNMYSGFNAPQRPSQSPQCDDLLSLSLAQDIAHVDGGYSSRQDNVPDQ
jgi:hypothetical protein